MEVSLRPVVGMRAYHSLTRVRAGRAILIPLSSVIHRTMSARAQVAPPATEGCASIVSDSRPLQTMAPALTGQVAATGGHTNHSPWLSQLPRLVKAPTNGRPSNRYICIL